MAQPPHRGQRPDRNERGSACEASGAGCNSEYSHPSGGVCRQAKQRKLTEKQNKECRPSSTSPASSPSSSSSSARRPSSGRSGRASTTGGGCVHVYNMDRMCTQLHVRYQAMCFSRLTILFVVFFSPYQYHLCMSCHVMCGVPLGRHTSADSRGDPVSAASCGN